MTLLNLLKRGFSPTVEALNLLLAHLLTSQKHRLAIHIFSQFSSNSVVPENPRTNYLVVHAMLQCGRFEEAERFVVQKERPDLFPRKRLWDLLVRGICVAGKKPERALLLLQDCVRGRGIWLSSATFNALVSSFCSVGDVEGAGKVVELMIADGRCAFEGDACSRIVGLGVDVLCKHGNVEKAIGFLNEVEKKGLVLTFVAYRAAVQSLTKLPVKEDVEDAVLKLLHMTEKLDPELQAFMWNESVICLCKEDFVEAALHVCLLMRREYSIISSNSYHVIIKRLIHAGMVQVAQMMLSAYVKEYGMIEHGLIDTIFLYLFKKNVAGSLDFLNKIGARRISPSVTTAVVDSLKKDNRIQEAHDFLVKARDTEIVVNLVAYSIVIDGLCKLGHIEKALELCELMKKSEINPNIVTYNSIINGLCQQGCLVEAFRLFNSLEQHSISPTVITYGILIDALSREGCLEDAKQLFEGMLLKNVTPNTHIYNSLIYGHCSFGLIRESLKFLHDLELNCLQPDAFTVSSLLGGFYVKGDMEGALAFYNEYKTKGVSPDILGFNCLIKGFCAKGRMEEGRSILRDMLQCQSITYQIDRASDGIDIGSLANLLNNLCEEGSIKDAVNVLDEISNFFFPSTRYGIVSMPICEFSETEMITTNKNPIERIESTHSELEKCHKKFNSNKNLANKTVSNIKSYSMEKECEVMGIFEIMRSHQPHDFATYYSALASLCSKGEIERAKSMVKEMLLNHRNFH